MELGKYILIALVILAVIYVAYQIIKWKVLNMDKEAAKDKAKNGVLDFFVNISEKLSNLKHKDDDSKF